MTQNDPVMSPLCPIKVLFQNPTRPYPGALLMPESRNGFELKQLGRNERGESNTTISSIAAIARGLGVHPRELLDFDFNLPKYPPLGN